MTSKKYDRPAIQRPIYREMEPKIIDEFWEYDKDGNKVEYAVIVGNGRSISYLRGETKGEAKEKARQEMRYLYNNPHVKLVYIEKKYAHERRKEEEEEKNKPKNKWKERIKQAEQNELLRKLRRS